ncbi:MAG: (Fe-S)-binding protein [Nitrospiraceae bacterium]|nr:(Fe-S)-binding protein [Nitrospiraceae bacterium]
MKKTDPATARPAGEISSGRLRAIAVLVREFEREVLGKLIEGNSMGKDLAPGARRRLLEEDAAGLSLENCARCGSCKARCPVYEITKNEAFSPRGRLMLLKGLAEGRISPAGGLLKRISACLLCGRCDVSCPVGIRPTEFIYRGREALRKLDTGRLMLRTALRMGLRQPAFGLGAARFLFLRGQSDGGKWNEFVKKVFPADIAFPTRLPSPRPSFMPGRSRQTGVIGPRKPSGRVAVFAGCVANYLVPETGEALVSMLVSMGYEVVMPRGEVCCGMPLRGLGLAREAERFAAKNIELFGKLNVEAVVTPCPTCADMIKNRYAELTGGGIEKAMDSTEFFLRKLEGKVAGGGPEPDGHSDGGKQRLIWHEPCHLRYGLGFNAGPVLALLDIERPVEAGCCGLGARLTDAETSEELLSGRVIAYKDAARVVTACPGCRMQLERGGIKTAHILEIIEERFFPETIPAPRD